MLASVTARGLAEEPIRLQSSGGTHQGRRRPRNEDAFLCDDFAGLWLVADGVGGREAGEIASRTTIEAIQGELWRDQATLPAESFDGAMARRAMERAIQAATYLIFGMAEVGGHERGMGTTVSALALLGDQLVSGQVGDSRIYRLHQGRCDQLTDDHTWVNLQLRAGRMSPEEAAKSPYKNLITRAVGQREYVEVDTAIWVPQAGDRFVLCSDGLHTYIEAEEWPSLCEGERQSVVDNLIDEANRRGGKDNITVVIVDVVQGRDSRSTLAPARP